jgi:hypothetical protein
MAWISLRQWKTTIAMNPKHGTEGDGVDMGAALNRESDIKKYMTI